MRQNTPAERVLSYLRYITGIVNAQFSFVYCENKARVLLMNSGFSYVSFLFFRVVAGQSAASFCLVTLIAVITWDFVTYTLGE
jgi:hypothetical protein